ncbi:predicted naringenin-chalcone synthase [Microbacterium testaceum StLB037]|uniref:Predicted naringenin-chalcone synthase n=1 Tax=Microbacterium testaceum (strain StLB037) TaxID=979556 RepID=E8N7B6_MICTS|nr:type III polyketide synthase [Microbacterium testaceum]BAJ75548.1 predicted naringenin-chalcone synthase [Microbacterium testaceum StLB037]
MTARILSIGTALPETRVAQSTLRDLFAAQPGFDRKAQRLVGAAFDAAAIDARHVVLPQLAGGDGGALGVRDGDTLLMPPTGARNDEYRRTAPALFAEASRAAIAGSGRTADAITHVVTVSCTGMFAPGPDFHLVRDLGLTPTAERYHLGFIGCAAAIPALRLAARIVAADPEAVVLVACAELCSLHWQTSSDPDQIVAASVFADGAAAAVVASGIDGSPGLDLDGFATHLTGEGERDMAWTVGDSGFEMTLTPEVPRIIGREIAAIAADVIGDLGEIDAWAVHPGGRSILDRVEQALDMDAAALAPSREVLRAHGNMSSATLLFILRDLLADPARDDGDRVAALAFGPGLTVEAARLTLRRA